MRLQGSSTLSTRCLEVIRRSPGIPAGVVAARLDKSYGVAVSALDRLVKAGILLTHMETNTDSAYLGRRVYYLPERHT